MRSQLRRLALCAPVLLFAACGGKRGTEVDYSRDLGVSSVNTSDDMVSVDLQAINRDAPASGLSLASADAFTYSITGCISGFEIIGNTEATTSFNLQNGDVNCELQLSSITVAGIAYDLSSVTTWSSGSSFTASNGSNEIRIDVISQLPSTITGASTVTITYGSLGTGTDGLIAAGVGTDLSISGATIDLDLSNSAATVDGSTGAGIFTFTLDCSTAIASGECNGVSLAGLEVSLDLNTGGGDLTLAQCQSNAQSGSSALNVGADGTTASTTQALTGPAPLFGPANSDLVLTVFDSSSNSCKYFKINIQS